MRLPLGNELPGGLGAHTHPPPSLLPLEANTGTSFPRSTEATPESARSNGGNSPSGATVAGISNTTYLLAWNGTFPQKHFLRNVQRSLIADLVIPNMPLLKYAFHVIPHLGCVQMYPSVISAARSSPGRCRICLRSRGSPLRGARRKAGWKRKSTASGGEKVVLGLSDSCHAPLQPPHISVPSGLRELFGYRWMGFVCMQGHSQVPIRVVVVVVRSAVMLTARAVAYLQGKLRRERMLGRKEMGECILRLAGCWVG